MHEVLVNRLGGLSLPRKSVVRLTDRPDMTLDVYRGRKTTIQQQQYKKSYSRQRQPASALRRFLVQVFHIWCTFNCTTTWELEIPVSVNG